MNEQLAYITADRVNAQSGGGLVTAQELLALQTLGPVRVISRKELESINYGRTDEPWMWDSLAYSRLDPPVKLAHLYAGTFGECVRKLKDTGAKVVYTCAAHDVEVSRQEHLKWLGSFPYNHLNDPVLWKQYCRGYVEADVVVCPSTNSAKVVREQVGRTGPIEIIPHGCTLPAEVPPLPEKFTVGYLGSCTAPDKGVRYLLQAWEKLGYREDEAELLLAGSDSKMILSLDWYKQFCPNTCNTIRCLGWVDNVSDFYSQISCLAQCSVTEGFGIEVLESLAHGRPVICSTGVGAVDLIGEFWRFPAGDTDRLVDAIKDARELFDAGMIQAGLSVRRGVAEQYTWDNIRQRYVNLWTRLLS